MRVNESSDGMWRLINSGPCRGSENMAVDVAIARAHAQGLVPPTLHFYSWQPPTVSLGYHQAIDGNVDLEACARHGYGLCRRPTGGRAILHDCEVTFSIIVSEAILGTSSVMDSYRVLAGPIVAALRSLGAPAELVDRTAAPARAKGGANPACFAAKARCDLMVNGRKLLGSAQLRRDGVVLEQNSLPLKLGYQRWGEIFVGAGGEALAQAATDLWTAAGREIAPSEVEAALSSAFEAELGVNLQPNELTDMEETWTEEVEPSLRLGN